jgi:uncharacterized membrane protein YcaP (DUF421 family)
MSFRHQWFARFAEPRVTTLIRHGRILRQNLTREMITDDELKSQLRESGVEELKEVKHARLEPDGQISVVKYQGGDVQKRRERPPGTA